MWVTIVIPSFNVVNYLEQAVYSALEQDYEQIEVIIVDNNSTDGTLALANGLAGKYPQRIRVLQATQQGASLARNIGWKAGKGEWLQFLDADDILLPGKISREVKLLEHATELIIGTPTYEDLQGQQTTLVPWPDPWKGLAHGMYAGQTSVYLFKRTLLESVDGWREKLPYTQDTDLLFRCLQLEVNWKTDETPGAICRDRPQGKITQSDPTGILIRHFHLRLALNKWLATHHPDYWQVHAPFFHSAAYRFLRMLSVHDPKQADELMSTYLPPPFRVKADVALGIPTWEKVIVNRLGLYHTALWKNRFKRIMPTATWQKLYQWFNV